MNNAVPTFYNRQSIEREIESIEHPHGMRLNDAKERPILPAGTLRRLLVVIDAQAERIKELEAQLANKNDPLAQVTGFNIPATFGGCPSCGRKDCVARACTRPAPAKQPLRDEQIFDFGPGQPDAVWSYEDQLYFARAIEAAHGIGEKK